jgi:hypothetical protein
MLISFLWRWCAGCRGQHCGRGAVQDGRPPARRRRALRLPKRMQVGALLALSRVLLDVHVRRAGAGHVT